MSAKLCKYTYFYIHDHLGSTSMVLDIDGNISQSVTYIPYGEIFVEERNGAWNSPYLFNSKELDEETGLYYYGARYLNPTNGMWLSTDPLFEKYVGATPYNYCHNNPIKITDPDGRGEFVDENGYTFANDGKADEKVFVKRIDLTKDEQKKYSNYVSKKSGNADFFQGEHWSYEGFIEVEGSLSNRKKMVDIVSQDDGTGGEVDKNRREYGGHISNGMVVEDPMGPVAGPGTNGGSIILYGAEGESTFHSHQSGEYKEQTEIGLMIMSFIQEPSNADIQISTATDYVFGMKDGIVRVYDKNGVKARIPLKRFVEFPRKNSYKP